MRYERNVSESESQHRRENWIHAVYLVKNSFDYYKIGCSTDLDQRIEQLQQDAPFEDRELIDYIEIRDPLVGERILHEIFDHKRVRGEWFSLDEADLDWIRENKQLIIDVSENLSRKVPLREISNHPDIRERFKETYQHKNPMTVRAIARRLGRSEDTIRKYANEGKIKAFRLGKGGSWIFYWGDVEDAIKHNPRLVTPKNNGDKEERELTCLYCGRRFLREEGYIKKIERRGYEAKYCSMKCLNLSKIHTED